MVLKLLLVHRFMNDNSGRSVFAFLNANLLQNPKFVSVLT